MQELTPIEVYTPEEVAEILKVPVRTVRTLIREGKLRCVRVSLSQTKNMRIPKQEVDRYIHENLDQTY